MLLAGFSMLKQNSLDAILDLAMYLDVKALMRNMERSQASNVQ